MKKHILISGLLLSTTLCLAANCCLGQEKAPPESDKRRPDQFAIIFNMGYAGDHFPQNKQQFEQLIQAVKQAHYNTVLCKYEDWRAEICAKHGVKIMVDLLVPEQHVYKNVEGAKTLCQKLRGSEVVYAYHLWSDRIGGTSAGRNRDASNVREWDPHHPAYVGSYNARELENVGDADLIGYYDFHWTRGGLWRHLLRAQQAADKTDTFFLRYAQGDPGKVGAGNYNRVLYTHSQSLAFGMKGYTYHHTGAEIDKSTWKWRPLGDDLARVNAQVAPLGPEMMKLGRPIAVYSTSITKTAKDRETESDTPIVPPELAPIPEDLWVHVDAGEAVMGLFEDGEGRAALFFANHNAYQPQAMQLRFAQPLKGVQQFDRKQAKWVDRKIIDMAVAFEIPPAAGELLRVSR